MKARPSQLALPIGIVGIVLLLVVPLPAAVLDLLIAFNITAAIAILLVAGFGAVLFTFLGASLLFPGQHSYAGV